ncbi:hypothetical protein IWX50DRAFT_699706 [Phyllosticta citricarpa]
MILSLRRTPGSKMKSQTADNSENTQPADVPSSEEISSSVSDTDTDKDEQRIAAVLDEPHVLPSISESEQQEDLPKYPNAVGSSPSLIHADVRDWKGSGTTPPSTGQTSTPPERAGDLAISQVDPQVPQTTERGLPTAEGVNLVSQTTTVCEQERSGVTSHDNWQSARSQQSVHTEPSTSTFNEKSDKDLGSGFIKPIKEGREGETGPDQKDPFLVDWEPNDPENPQNCRRQGQVEHHSHDLIRDIPGVSSSPQKISSKCPNEA